MKAGVLYGQNDMRYVDWPEPETEPGTVKVRVKACGICGSDVPRVLGTEARYYPIILGHEFAGEVVEAAPDVLTLGPGDRIAGVPLLPCMTCPDCRRGGYALCKNYGFIGSRAPGAFAEYVVVPESNCIKMGPDVPYITGAMFEPAAVALHGAIGAFDSDCGATGASDSGCGRGDEGVGLGSVLVLGAGTIGIFAMQWARIHGAKRIAVCDVEPERLSLASELGADAVFDTRDPDFKAQIDAYTEGRGFPYVFETAGQPATIKLGFELVGGHGAMTCIGTPHVDFDFTWKQWELLNRKEFRLTGTWMSYSAPFPGKEWSLTAHHFGRGDLRLHESMIYKTIPLSEISEAFGLFKTPGAVKGKVIISI